MKFKLFLSLSIQILCVLLPWRVRSFILRKCLRFGIAQNARIGFSLICAERVDLAVGARIGHFTVVKGLSRLVLGRYASIGRGNWISAFPRTNYRHFSKEGNRDPSLVLGDHSAITNRHIIDCTALVEIGQFTTFAGFRSQILTHSIELALSRQQSHPIEIGSYCFLGTGCIILGGGKLPDYSVLGAGAVLNKDFYQDYMLYAGAPARPVKELPEDLAYFQRGVGFVD
ncbi:acyltransferase [Paraburkholderia sp. GAS348]|uniref:acyltransferase n=1 Tax=Paraburkholderia sp. GAS348 TaxID=3035132 RepID=UPI003D1B7A35